MDHGSPPPQSVTTRSPLADHDVDWIRGCPVGRSTVTRLAGGLPSQRPCRGARRDHRDPPLHHAIRHNLDYLATLLCDGNRSPSRSTATPWGSLRPWRELAISAVALGSSPATTLSLPAVISTPRCSPPEVGSSKISLPVLPATKTSAGGVHLQRGRETEVRLGRRDTDRPVARTVHRRWLSECALPRIRTQLVPW